jgi:hypothetical protein
VVGFDKLGKETVITWFHDYGISYSRELTKVLSLKAMGVDFQVAPEEEAILHPLFKISGA